MPRTAHFPGRAPGGSTGRVPHRNLVSLLGYCIHGDQRLLVYEHVPNHTLESHLHHAGDGPTLLDWERRWRIALGAAKGLAYLHEDCHPKIIHRDIKAANILLDDNFEPKVADFGLAKIQHGDDSHVSTRVMGTFGYMAPEYTNTGKITDRSDVFSFGVVLLEIITGKRPVLSDEPDEDDETLVSWARPLLTKALDGELSVELIDPRLEANYDAHEMQRLIACAAAADGVPAAGADSDNTGATGFVSEATSEYGLCASSSSSDGDAAQSTSRAPDGQHPGVASHAAGHNVGRAGRHSGELGAMSRRTRPGRAGLE
uniref:non-specific serine/threonine protein kinase n=1 Tax=Aegilops tauschii TaxID=37682 RepID=R7W300_AEGTA